MGRGLGWWAGVSAFGRWSSVLSRVSSSSSSKRSIDVDLLLEQEPEPELQMELGGDGDGHVRNEPAHVNHSAKCHDFSSAR